MTKELSDKTSDWPNIEPLPKGLIQIGGSIYVDTSVKLRDVLTGKRDIIDYLRYMKRQIDDYLLDAFRY